MISPVLFYHEENWLLEGKVGDSKNFAVSYHYIYIQCGNCTCHLSSEEYSYSISVSKVLSKVDMTALVSNIK